jgi:hypothetical protein
MATQNRRGGCGCCGCLLAFFLLLSALILVGVGFFYFNATNNLNRVPATGPVSSPAVTRQTYIAARQKFDHFFADAAERGLALSNDEVNALLVQSPELRILRHGTVVVLNQNSAEVSCNLPVNLPFLPRRYLNCSFQVRPSIRAQQLELDVSRIEREGRPLGPVEAHQYRFIVVPVIEKTLSSLNMIQGDRSVRELRIENGNLVLGR